MVRWDDTWLNLHTYYAEPKCKGTRCKLLTLTRLRGLRLACVKSIWKTAHMDTVYTWKFGPALRARALLLPVKLLFQQLTWKKKTAKKSLYLRQVAMDFLRHTFTNLKSQSRQLSSHLPGGTSPQKTPIGVFATTAGPWNMPPCSDQ